MNKQHRRSLAVALVTFLVVSCGSAGGGGDFNLISIEEEWQLGQQLSQEVAKQVRFNNDPVVNAYVRSVGQRIVSTTSMANLPWNFYVVDDPAINAFALPGGHVYVNTGLIQHADNASELAGVMAHEISHVTARHSTEQISKQYGLSILAGLVLGQNPGQLAQIAAQIIGTGAVARFSRDAEREADELGQKAMYAAGYDPMGMVTMFEELLENQQSSPSRVEQFFSTHPLTQDRIRDARSRASQFQGRSVVTDEPEFQNIKRRV
jgi:beta-barrel assembly-enhancing protease